MMDDTALLTTLATDALTVAKCSAVKTATDYIEAGNFLKVIKERSARIVAYWKPKKDQAAALHKSLVAAEKELLAPLEQAESIIKAGMLAYQKEQDRIRQEAERERRRQEEDARMKMEEARRLVAEAQQKEELDEADVEILLMAQAEVDAAESAIAPPPPPAAKVQGVSTRKTWKARVVNDKLVPVAMMGITLRPVDMTALNRLAVASSGGAEVPGVEFFQEESVSVRY